MKPHDIEENCRRLSHRLASYLITNCELLEELQGAKNQKGKYISVFEVDKISYPTKFFSIRSVKNFLKVQLEWNEKFVFCLDNDMMYAEEMIYKIEKRTGVDFRNIKIKGQKEDFTGLRFFNGGWKRDFWGNFPSKDEIEAYIKLKNGKR